MRLVERRRLRRFGQLLGVEYISHAIQLVTRHADGAGVVADLHKRLNKPCRQRKYGAHQRRIAHAVQRKQAAGHNQRGEGKLGDDAEYRKARQTDPQILAVRLQLVAHRVLKRGIAFLATAESTQHALGLGEFDKPVVDLDAFDVQDVVGLADKRRGSLRCEPEQRGENNHHQAHAPVEEQHAYGDDRRRHDTVNQRVDQMRGRRGHEHRALRDHLRDLADGVGMEPAERQAHELVAYPLMLHAHHRSGDAVRLRGLLHMHQRRNNRQHQRQDERPPDQRAVEQRFEHGQHRHDHRAFGGCGHHHPHQRALEHAAVFVAKYGQQISDHRPASSYSRHIELYSPPAATNSLCVPCSAMRPSFITTI